MINSLYITPLLIYIVSSQSILKSPFKDAFCPKNGGIYNVGGFISSPYKILLFNDIFKNPEN